MRCASNLGGGGGVGGSKSKEFLPFCMMQFDLFTISSEEY